MAGRIRLLEVGPYKEAVKDQPETPPEDLGLWKYHSAEVKQTEEDRVLEFVISDGQVDRDRDVINPKGWTLKDYRKNPVVLWAHDSRSLPIARAKKVSTDGDQLVALAEFTDPDLNPFGDMVYRMFQGRFLNATSVGFRPTKFQWVQGDDEERRGGIDFEKQELLEFSAVPIPANPRALQRREMLWLASAHEAGIDTSPLRKWAEEILDLDEEIKGLTRTEIENAWKVITQRQLFVQLGDPDEAGISSITFVESEEKAAEIAAATAAAAEAAAAALASAHPRREVCGLLEAAHTEPCDKADPGSAVTVRCPVCRSENYSEAKAGTSMVEPIDPVIRTCSSCEYSWRASAQTSLDELSAKLQKELDSSRGVASRDQIREVVLEVLDERSKEAEEEDDDPEVEEIENDLSWDPDPYPPAEDPEVDVELEQVSEIFGRLLEERIASAGSGSADS